ncbi:MAG: DUF4238 domain-containing protein [Pseudomonadota bacterium]
MNSPKRHHYVPESYLLGFKEDGTEFAHVYSKRTNSWRRQRPQQIMVVGQYYRQEWAPEGVDKNILENFLGTELEPNGLSSLQRLIDNPDELNEQGIANILEYLQFQRIRVPRQAELAKGVVQQSMASTLQKTSLGADALKHVRIEIKDSFHVEFMRVTHGLLSPYFSRMIWEVVEAEPGSSFITTDSPVTFFNADFIPPAEPGVALYGTIVLFPINKRYLLLMTHPEYKKQQKKSSDVLPPDLQIEDGFVEIRKGIVWDSRRVLHHNQAMFHLSYDLIVGDSKSVLEQVVGKPL